MKKNFESKIFSLFYLCYFASMGGFLPYINQYLQTNLGLTGKQLGIFTFTTLIISVLIAPYWGVIGDKTKKYKLLLLISLSASLIAAFNYSMQVGYVAVIISGVILELCRSGSIPMSDVQAVNYASKYNANYGSIRSMGSLGYVIGSLAVGFFVKANDYSPIFTVYMVLLFLCIFLAFGFPKTDIQVVETEEEVEKETEKKESSIKLVLKNKKFLFIASISLLTGILMDSANGYAAIHMVSTLNGAANSASIFTFVTALPEILLLGIIGKAFSKYGYKKIYFINALVLIVRYIAYALAPNYIIFLLFSVLHCITVACSTVGNLSYLKHSVDENAYATAVTLNTATISIGRAIYSLLFGYMLDLTGSRSIFIFSAVFMGIAAIVISRSKFFHDIDTEVMVENNA